MRRKSDTHRDTLCPYSKISRVIGSKKIIRVPCGVTGLVRSSSVRFHDCLNPTPPGEYEQPVLSFPPASDSGYNPSQQNRSRRTPETEEQKQFRKLLGKLVAGTALSLLFATSPHTLGVLADFVHLGQTNPDKDINDIISPLTPQKLSDTIQESGTEAAFEVLDQLSDTRVSVMFDSSTINHQKYIAVTLTPVEPNAKTYFYHLAKSPSDSTEFSQFTLSLIAQLEHYNIEVVSICTDGLQAQIGGIQDCLKKLQSGNALEFLPRKPLLLPFHTPCLNHRVNLVLVHLLKNHPTLSALQHTICDFSDKASTKERKEKLAKYCPTLIHSRWLSLSLICSYIRLKRSIITSEHYLPESDLTSTVRLEIILRPLMDLHLFFEKETTKLIYAFPAVLRSFQLYFDILKHPAFKNDVWATAVGEALRLLYAMTLAGETGDKLALSFSFSPAGRFLYNTGRFASAFNPHRSLGEIVAALFVISFLLLLSSLQ